MAPIAAETAPSAQRQARRLPARIVPAIPHRLSRTRNTLAPRPITPDESTKGAAEKQEPEPLPAVETQSKEQLQPPTPSAEAPMTPDSRAATDEKSEEETTVLAASPANSADDHVELAAQHPGKFGARTRNFQQRTYTDLLSLR